MKKYFVNILLIMLLVVSGACNNKKTVFIVTDAEIPESNQFGLSKIEMALTNKGYQIIHTDKIPDKKGICILSATAKSPLLAEEIINCIGKKEESFLIQLQDKKIALAGRDAIGLMYAQLELASQIQAAKNNGNLLKYISGINESPFSTERSLSTYISTEHVRKGFWHDSVYWDRMFTQLAECRINSYDIIFKVQPPIYKLFFDVEGYPAEMLGGMAIPEVEQNKNLKALQRIVNQAHNHGVKITLGIWNHVQNPEDADRLAPYTEAAIAKIVNIVPFDAFQFRMHWESGLPQDPETLKRFWGRVFDGINTSGRKIKIFPRAKGLPNEVIEIAEEKNMDFAIETKYSAEQMGMPFHPAHIQVQNQFDRRHGYADLLTYPKRYNVLYRMWSWGSQKILTWGSYNYVQRWVKSTALFNEEGIFEIMQIEGAKPMGNGTTQALSTEYIGTEYEFQRYWYQNMLFGRLGYNPETPPEIFEREFISRYGRKGGPQLMTAMEEAGMIIPRIIGSAMPDFQEARGVPEWGSGSGLGAKATLKSYAGIAPLDIQTFISFKEAAQLMLKGENSPRVWPQQTAKWYEECAQKVLDKAQKAEAAAGKGASKEFLAALTDLRILAGMAKFHAKRIYAALAYNLYDQSGGSQKALNEMIKWESEALTAYDKVVKTAGDTYRQDLNISVSDAGHWKEEYALLLKAFEELKTLQSKNDKEIPALIRPTDKDILPPKVEHSPVTILEIDKPLVIKATITDQSGVKYANVKYRGVTQFQDYETAVMTIEDGFYKAEIAPETLQRITEYNEETGALWNFMYFIETSDEKGNGCIYPDYNITDPYFIAATPHKSMEETGGKYRYSEIKDRTYLSKFHDRPQFEMVSPVNNDVFMEGQDIIVKLFHPWTDPNEKITIYSNSQEIKAEKTGELEFKIKGLNNGLYKINAFVSKTGLIAWSNTVEIVVGESRAKR